MKRGKGLTRRVGLNPGKGLARTGTLKNGKPLERRTKLKARSPKMVKIYKVRYRLVEDFLEAHPVCQRCKSSRSTAVHEPLLRSRGGDILDEANCTALCDPCHGWVHENPELATAEGWMRHSWDGVADDYEEPSEVSSCDDEGGWSSATAPAGAR